MAQMSAFSRGFSLRPRCLFSKAPGFNVQFTTTVRSPFPRCFSTSQSLHYAVQNARSARHNGVNVTIKKILQSPPIYQSFADFLASKSHSTLLYVAPSHTMYIISSYAAAFFCFAYATYNFYVHYLNPPPNVKRWISLGFGVVCFGVACIGGYLVLGPARLVKTITATPSAQALMKGAGGHGPLMIEIELAKMLPLPFLQARKLIVAPEDMSLNRRIYVPPVDPYRHAAERLEERKRLESEQEEERRKSILLRPFRDASRAFHKFFNAMRLVWTRESFLKLGVKRQMYKLDIGGGWALDEGKALDRLVRVKALN